MMFHFYCLDGSRIPTELRHEAAQIKHSMKYDDSVRAGIFIINKSNVSTFYMLLGITTHEDDEYVWAGVEDPKVVITTSHNPSSSLKQFAKVN